MLGSHIGDLVRHSADAQSRRDVDNSSTAEVSGSVSLDVNLERLLILHVLGDSSRHDENALSIDVHNPFEVTDVGLIHWNVLATVNLS